MKSLGYLLGDAYVDSVSLDPMEGVLDAKLRATLIDGFTFTALF